MRRKVASIEVSRFYAHEGRVSIGCKNTKRKQSKKERLAIRVEEKPVHFSSQYLFFVPLIPQTSRALQKETPTMYLRVCLKIQSGLMQGRQWGIETYYHLFSKCKIADWNYLLWHGKSRGGGKKFGFNNDDACGDPGIVLGAEENAMEFKLGGFFMLGMMLLIGGLQSKGNENT